LEKVFLKGFNGRDCDRKIDNGGNGAAGSNGEDGSSGNEWFTGRERGMVESTATREA